MQIAKKLKSRSGASIIIALIVFLFCVVLSSIVLTAALTNKQILISAKNAQKSQLALSSAARLFGDAFENTQIQIKKSADGRNVTVNVLSPKKDSNFSELQNELAKNVYIFKTAQKKSLTVEADGSAKIIANISMNADYDIEIVFSNAQNNAKLNLYINAYVSDKAEPTVDWKTYQITKGGA